MRISALLTDGAPRECLRWITLSDHTVLTSHALQSEFDDVVRRKSLTRTVERITLFAAMNRREQTIETDPDFAPICRDPDDDQVLACAVAGGADGILSGDRDLLILTPFRGIRIFTPRQFLAEFNTDNPVP